MEKNIVVYTSNTWGYCHMVMDYLKEKDVSFEEKNVSTDASARKELMKAGFMGVPVIYVGDEVIQGFDKEKLDEMLK